MCFVFLLFVGFIRDSMREIVDCINVKLPVGGLFHVEFCILGFLISIIMMGVVHYVFIYGLNVVSISAYKS
jgi:hypothetical protein